MGYHAPSAEQVYRYALRLDGERRLTDRFGWSIVLVNDNSPVCRELLSRYCIDLCQHTADRIRFVFFSELPREHFERAARALNEGRRDRRGGLLAAAVGEPAHLDFEEAPWRALRPPSLWPLRSLDEIDERLSFETQHLTAMPGTGIAREFAHRLGIGRHVPCILIFTEIGELSVDLLPIRGTAAEDVYERVRGWIDDYYEDNRARIDEWRTIEEEIEQLGGNARASLHAIERWRDSRVQAWCALALIARAIHTVEQGTHGALRAELRRQRGVPSELGSILDWMEAELSARVAAAEDEPAIAQALDRISSASHRPALREALRRAHERFPSERLLAAVESLAEGEDRWHEVADWWQRRGDNQLSLQQHKRLRAAWARGPKRKHIGAHREYAIVLEHVGALPLGVVPGPAVEAAFAALATAMEADGSSEAYRFATVEHRTALHDFVRDVGESAPRWLLAPPVLTVREALSIGRELADPRRAVRALDGMHRLGRRLAEVAANGDPATVRRHAEEDGAARTLAIATLRDAQELRHRRRDDAVDEVREQALAQLQTLRRRLEADAFAGADGTPETGAFDEGLAARLHQALDRYGEVTDTITFPHRRDPRVIRVETRVSVVDAAEVERPAPLERADQLRASITAARATHSGIARARVEAIERVNRHNPVSRLDGALGVLPAGRRAILPPTVRIVADHLVWDVLQELEDDERAAIGGRLGCGAAIADILIALGLYTGPDPKRRRDEFDVFVAYNSADRAAVLDIVMLLRARSLHPWVDVDQVRAGRWWPEVIERAIPTVRAAAIVLGRHGLGNFQMGELQVFHARCTRHGLPLIPVLLPGVDAIPDELPFLQARHHVRFDRPRDELAIEQLVRGIVGDRAA